MDYNVRFNLAKTAALVVGAAIISVTTSAVVASRAPATQRAPVVFPETKDRPARSTVGQFGRVANSR